MAFINLMRKIQNDIEADIADSVRRVKNDFECIGEKCYIYHQCCRTNANGNKYWEETRKNSSESAMKKRKKCEWDLRGMYFD